VTNAPRYICWLRSFDGAVWVADHDETAGAVICKPYDQVADIGAATYAAVRAWRLLTGLPIPP
jgi:hypothetical protein